MDRATRSGEATKRVHYVFAGARRIAVFTQDDAPTPSETLRYLHHDHLGSVDTITGATATVVERLSYDAFGKRRTASGTSVWRDAALTITGAETRRGFTGHEHLDAFALIHMNGRVYDPHLGRFLSADPFIQFPASTQGLNRYSYVLNNPLSLTDPSGYFSLGSLFKPLRNVAQGVVKAVKRIIRSKVVQTVVTIAAGAYCGAQCAAAASAAFAATNGGDLGEVVFAAALTYVSAVAYSEVGTHVSHAAAKTVAHGVVGGVVAEVGGGRFRDGFIAAASAQFAAPWIDGLDSGNSGISPVRTTAAAVVGGTAAKLGGGKFANGAATAAFGRLFNDEMHRRQTQGPSDGCPAGILVCRPTNTSGVGYERRPTFFERLFRLEPSLVEWGRYECTGQGGSCSFVGPGGGLNLFGVEEHHVWQWRHGEFAPFPVQKITTFVVDPSNLDHRDQYGPEFLDAMERNS